MGRTSNAPTKLKEALIELIWTQCYSSVTIDAICAAAEVRKGSFYHFYRSKTELTVAAFEHLWETESRPHMDMIFSATVPPRERFANWIDFGRSKLEEQKVLHGRILGCPFFNIAQETSTIEPEVAAITAEMLDRYLRYLVAALADASREGEAGIADPESTARAILALVQGSITQARIQNSTVPLDSLADNVARLAGMAPRTAVAAI